MHRSSQARKALSVCALVVRVRLRQPLAAHAVQYAAGRERLKAVQGQMEALREHLAKEGDVRLVALQQQFTEEKATLEAVSVALESELKLMQDRVAEAAADRGLLTKRVAELEQQLSRSTLDGVAVVQDLEAKLDESQAANADLQRTHQRQVGQSLQPCVSV